MTETPAPVPPTSPISPPTQPATDSPLRRSTTDRLLHLLAREQVDKRLPSVVAGLVRGGEVVWWAARGRVGEGRPAPTTQYRIGSITKTFVGAAVMRAREEGLVDLDTAIGAHLPELIDRSGIAHLTVGQLLGQASGLHAETDGAGPWWERTPGGDWEQLLPALGADAQRHRAGVRFHYSNLGFGVLGELVARLRGAAWHEVVETELLTPLGMSRTALRPDDDAAPGLAVHPWADVVLPEPEHDAGAMAPAGQLWSTVHDLARWAAVLGGTSDVEVLSPATLALMRQPQVVDDPREAAWATAYGLGVQLWNAGGRRYVGHGGSMPGFIAGVRVDVESGDGVIAMTNSTTGFGDLPTRLLDVLAEEEPPLPVEWTPTAVAPEVMELVGPWYWGPAPLVVRADPTGPAGSFTLAGLERAARASRFRPNADGTWTGLDAYYAGENLRVVRDAAGAVSHLDLATFRLTRTPYDPDADVPGGVDEGGWRA